MTINLGTLEYVDVREIWRDEASDFTPWLAESKHLILLGQSLNMDLVVESTECFVGANRIDILAKDILSDSLVIIENQLEKSDHSHFGQIITYAGGVDAKSAIWIAASFSDEHLKAIEWSNKVSKFQIFAVTLEVCRIGDSLPSPLFSVIASTLAVARKSKRIDAKSAYNLPQDIKAWISTTKTATSEEIAVKTGVSKRRIMAAMRTGKLQTASRNHSLVLLSSLAPWLETLSLSEANGDTEQSPLETQTVSEERETDETPVLHLVNG